MRMIAAVGICLSIAAAPAHAEPPADSAGPAVADPAGPAVAPAVNTDPPPAAPNVNPSGVPSGPIPSGNPGTLTTPEGLVLTVVGSKESLTPVTSLNNTPWSREYIVDGVFNGNVSGPGHDTAEGGILEAGYQIGCGITQQDLHSISTAGVTPGTGIPLLDGEGLFPFFISANASQQLRLVLEPGRVNNVSVTRKDFEGDWARVSINGLRIRVDGCSGQSFIRSFATFTSSSDDNAAVVTYLGVTRAV